MGEKQSFYEFDFRGFTDKMRASLMKIMKKVFEPEKYITGEELVQRAYQTIDKEALRTKNRLSWRNS